MYADIKQRKGTNTEMWEAGDSGNNLLYTLISWCFHHGQQTGLSAASEWFLDYFSIASGLHFQDEMG